MKGALPQPAYPPESHFRREAAIIQLQVVVVVERIGSRKFRVSFSFVILFTLFLYVPKILTFWDFRGVAAPETLINWRHLLTLCFPRCLSFCDFYLCATRAFLVPIEGAATSQVYK